MTIKEMIDCIVKGIPVEYKGIKCIPVGYGARRWRIDGKVHREFILIEENSKSDGCYVIDEIGVKYNTVRQEPYTTAVIEHRITLEDIRLIDSIVYRDKELKEREQILKMRAAQGEKV